MRFLEKKSIFIGLLSTTVLLTMLGSGFCETLNFPDEYSAMEQQIYATMQEALPRCTDCHAPMAEPHHAVYFPGGDPNSLYNPYCPDPPPPSGQICQPCHFHYDDNCESVSNPYLPYGNGCGACHTIPSVCGFEDLEFPSQCVAQLLGPCHQEPQTPAEMIQNVINTVISLNLQQGISNSLDAKLESALGALDDVNANNDVAAINTLNALINAVEAQRGNKITDEDADMLIAAAQAIIDKLESP